MIVLLKSRMKGVGDFVWCAYKDDCFVDLHYLDLSPDPIASMEREVKTHKALA